jgi:hypothetical protein
MDEHKHGRQLTVKKALIGAVLLTLAPALWAVPRFDPNTECTSELRGPYPWEYKELVHRHIKATFYDPGSVTDLEIFKPAPGWWTTAAFKTTRKNTKCYWYVAFYVNAKNRLGGYVGRKAHGLWIREGRIVHSSERSGVEANVITEGEQAFDEELAKLPEDERQQALELAEEDTGEADVGAPDYIQELRELAKLRDEGILSEEEFQKKKKEILGLDRDEEDGGSR